MGAPVPTPRKSAYRQLRFAGADCPGRTGCHHAGWRPGVQVETPFERLDPRAAYGAGETRDVAAGAEEG